MAAEVNYIDYKQYTLNKSIYYIYAILPNNKCSSKIFITLQVSQRIKRHDKLGYIEDQNGVKTLLQAPLSGTITQIKKIYADKTKQNKIHIATMRICQHFPKAKQINQQTNPDSPSNDICKYCQEPIQFYYQQNQTEVSLSQFKKSFRSFKASQVEWKMVLNQKFTRDTQICGNDEESYTINATGKITFMFQFGKQEPRKITSSTVVLKYKKIVCYHEKIAKNVCLNCLTDIKQIKHLKLRRYLFQLDQENFNQNVFLSGYALQNQAKQFKNQLLKKKKAILILDLDNTILHSISLRRVSQQMKNQISQFIIIPPGQASSIFIQKTLVKLRPNLGYFLEQIVDLYEIFIYTKGTRLYAQQICKAIKNKYKQILKNTKNFSLHRIISRDEDPDLIKKNLQYVIPKIRDFMLILDDRRDVWNHSPLCIYTKPYVFFYYVAVTQDGKTKIQPVEWQKGGGSLQHPLNQFQSKCLKQIQQAENVGNQGAAIQKIIELQESISHSSNQNSQQKNIIIGTDHKPEVIQQVVNKEVSKLQKASKDQNQSLIKSSDELIIRQKIQKFDVSSPEEGKQLKNKQSTIDQFLITTAFALKQAHQIYFNKLELPNDPQKKQGKFADLGQCFQQYKKSTLDHVSAYFAIKDYKKSPTYRRAQKLGLRVIENLHQHIDIIIRPNNFVQGSAENQSILNKSANIVINKIKNSALVKKIPVVSQTWIDTCYQYSCCLDFSNFQHSQPLTKVIFNSQIQIEKAVGQSTRNASNKIKVILDSEKACTSSK